MEEPCRIFISVSDTGLEDKFFEEILPEDELSDEFHNRQSLLDDGDILLQGSQHFSHDPHTFTKTEDSVETLSSAQTFPDNIIKKELISDAVDTHILVKQEIIEGESKYEYTPSDTNVPVKEELIPSISDYGLMSGHIVVKDELILMDTDQEILVNKCLTSDLSIVTNERTIGETNYKTKAETELDTLACLNTSEESTGHNFECEVCHKSFIHVKKLLIHKLIHIHIQKYVCDVCKKGFNTSSNLSRHKLTHSRIRYYQCYECKETFIRSSELKSHKLRHSKIRKYQCNECSKTFTRSSDLSTHKLRHSGIRKYQCDECSKAFTTSSDLSAHKLRHIGIRKYQCDECNKTFATSSNLSTHKLIHTGIRNYQCDECSKTYTTSSNLSSHKLTHGIKKYQCNLCNKAFTYSSNLNRHKLIHTCK